MGMRCAFSNYPLNGLLLNNLLTNSKIAVDLLTILLLRIPGLVIGFEVNQFPFQIKYFDTAVRIT